MENVMSTNDTLGERADTYNVLGVPISITTLDHASEMIHVWARDAKGRMIFVRDVHGIMQARKSNELMQLHKEAAMVTPDGMPLVWLGQLAKHPVKRTCGPDLMERLVADSEKTGLKHYFYGGKPGVAQALKKILNQKYPNSNIVGLGTPPFRPLTNDELTEAAGEINRSGADVVWVGISTPKQEFLMNDLCPMVTSTLIGVGAAFDFHLGAVTRAPKWMQRLGLEWVWRLCSEPKRLWRRYLVLAPKFVVEVIISFIIGERSTETQKKQSKR
jgi:N-acetylglucosaminyldiphosphoundecaprenol N-acetyl-beta-D-mannosaminyltransferase